MGPPPLDGGVDGVGRARRARRRDRRTASAPAGADGPGGSSGSMATQASTGSSRPLASIGPEGLVGDDLAGGGVGGRADHHRARIGGHLQALGGVHHVAHGRVVAAGPQGTDQHLARVHPDAHLDGHAALGPGGGQALLHAQRGPHRPLGVVLVGHRRAEQGDDGVAHDLVDPPAERGDVADEALEARVDQVLDLLGVGRLAQGREAHQVGEQHGGHPSLVAEADQRLPAARTEARAVGHERATARTGHVTSIRGAAPRPPGAVGPSSGWPGPAMAAGQSQ